MQSRRNASRNEMQLKHIFKKKREKKGKRRCEHARKDEKELVQCRVQCFSHFFCFVMIARTLSARAKLKAA